MTAKAATAAAACRTIAPADGAKGGGQSGADTWREGKGTLSRSRLATGTRGRGKIARRKKAGRPDASNPARHHLHCDAYPAGRPLTTTAGARHLHHPPPLQHLRGIWRPRGWHDGRRRQLLVSPHFTWAVITHLYMDVEKGIAVSALCHRCRSRATVWRESTGLDFRPREHWKPVIGRRSRHPSTGSSAPGVYAAAGVRDVHHLAAACILVVDAKSAKMSRQGRWRPSRPSPSPGAPGRHDLPTARDGDQREVNWMTI